MRTSAIVFAAAWVVTLLVARVGASQSLSSSTSPLSLVGCVAVEDTAGRHFVASDRVRRLKHRPRPIDLDADTGGLRVVGALIPTANIAAQAGSIDPTISAMAMSRARPMETGERRIVELRSMPTQTVRGSCGPR